MTTIERCGTHNIYGSRVTMHRHTFGDMGDCWSNHWLIHRPERPARGWLGSVLSQVIRPAGSGVPGAFFAHSPYFRRCGRGKLLVVQRCGYDI